MLVVYNLEKEQKIFAYLILIYESVLASWKSINQKE